MEGDRTWPVWAFLLGSGLRIGELVWLRWPNVDLRERSVRIVDFASTLGHDLVPSMGKSHDAVRTIDLDDGLVKVLKAQRKRQAQEALDTQRVMRRASMCSPSRVVALTTPNACRGFSVTTAKELGLPRLTAHGLRHTSATLMLAGGVPPKVAAERLGHSDPTLFTNLYSTSRRRCRGMLPIESASCCLQRRIPIRKCATDNARLRIVGQERQELGAVSSLGSAKSAIRRPADK